MGSACIDFSDVHKLAWRVTPNIDFKGCTPLVDVKSNRSKSLLTCALIIHGHYYCTAHALCSDLLSVQCYTWTEYKFTCVCLSVCASVTLSVNSPKSQTPQRIFTVDSLKDADLRKDVPFGGLDDE